jgi:hypothetical protein
VSGFIGVSLPQSMFSWSISADGRRFRAGRALGWFALSLSARRRGLLGDVRRKAERVPLRLTENRGFGIGSVAQSVLQERRFEGETGMWCCDVGEVFVARV